MLRRTFFKWVGSVAVVALVTTQGFRPAAAGTPLPTPDPVQKIETGFSPVLQVLNDWNEARWREHGGVLHEDGSRLIWNPWRQEFNRLPQMLQQVEAITAPRGYKERLTYEALLKASKERRVQGRVTRRNLVDSFLR